MKKVLDCSNCEFGAPNGSMCSVVANRTVRELVKLGYDTMSDIQTASETVSRLVATNLVARDTAEAECELLLLQHQSVRQGYGTVTY
jgi:hypothetical protein